MPKLEEYKIKSLKEKQCDICYQWYNKKLLKGGICPDCLDEIGIIPDTFSFEEKKDFVKHFKNNKKKNIFRSLTQNDAKQLKKCKSCVWLRRIDYLKLKIHCASPACKKVV